MKSDKSNTVVGNGEKYVVEILDAINVVKKEFDFDEIQGLCFHAFILGCWIEMSEGEINSLVSIALEHISGEKFDKAIERMKELLEEDLERKDK